MEEHGSFGDLEENDLNLHPQISTSLKFQIDFIIIIYLVTIY